MLNFRRCRLILRTEEIMGDHLGHMQENTVSSLLQLKMLEGTMRRGQILLCLQLTQNIELIIKLVK